MSFSRRSLLLGLAGLLPGCTELPQPYRGRPGALARRLARPPAYRLAVPAPVRAMLDPAEAEAFARALAEAMLAEEIPTTAGEPLPLDWQVDTAVSPEGAAVVPRFTLRDGDGEALGRVTGAPVPAAEWVTGSAATLRRAAGAAAPELADLVARVDAERRTGDERATGYAPPVVLLRPVRGAPGDGNRSLTARMTERLAGLGMQVQDRADGAQFAVTGVVTMAAAARGQQRVEIVWTVSRRDGHDLGRVLQLNEVPSGSLNGLWGDVAYVVAEEAAGGVRDVIANAGGLAGRDSPAAGPAPAAEAPAAAEAADEAPPPPPPPAPPLRRRRR